LTGTLLRVSALLMTAAAMLCGPAQVAGAEELRFAAATRCAAPAAIAALGAALPQVKARIKAGQPLKIVAIGSSSTQGYGASRPELAYPPRLEAELRRRLPGHEVSVLNRGIGGQESMQELDRLDRDVIDEAPQLAVWQLGSNGALRRHGVAGMAAALGEGIARLRAHGIDIVLMNAQFAPRMLEAPLLGQYLVALTQIAETEHVGLFNRFAVMRDWIDSGAMAPGEPLIADGLHQNDLGYGCVALVLADAILAAADWRPGRVHQARDARQLRRPPGDPARGEDAGQPARAHDKVGLVHEGLQGRLLPAAAEAP